MTTWNEAVGELHELWGDSLQDLYDEMDSWGGEEVGRVTWQPDLSFDFDDNGLVTVVRLTVGLELLTPVWAKRSDANDAVRAEWDRWSQALMNHEWGHFNLVHEYLDEFDASLVGLSQTAANEAFQERLTALQAASDAYDHETDHGVNQGTTLDTSIT